MGSFINFWKVPIEYKLYFLTIVIELYQMELLNTGIAPMAISSRKKAHVQNKKTREKLSIFSIFILNNSNLPFSPQNIYATDHGQKTIQHLL